MGPDRIPGTPVVPQDPRPDVRFKTARYPHSGAARAPPRQPMDLILTFHSLDTSGSVISFRPDEFRSLVEGLLEEGVSLVGMDELVRGEPEDDRPRALLTFDDGFSSVHEHALPLLADLQVPALMYVVSGWVGRTNRWPTQGSEAPEFQLMSWEQLRELQAGGIELGSHTVHHPHLPELGGQAVEEELRLSQAQMEAELQLPVRHFSYPYGSYSQADVDVARQHYDTATTTDMRWRVEEDDPLQLPRIDAYYLRDPNRWAPIFGARTRAYLKGRAALRKVANHLRR